ncbi:uncharacterized protein MYCFIDRAFT_177270 [Pseudocercospora fijiensis CIRAD86]|uniref:Uncharacterized protein n=1 Tax=Pseudocercospora fijiensis (strain CIRAD86) TaxID=383855 RepID=M3AT62_PSEFD|nr:uncharacterized protein MYCFIDRAFT_177270 [Pseudocercospora fijiensis CIRAD86]EME80313.1 hypothetical protein MYCFIDRAFT_177270 [Pseudocercospora fijiensis CIRAD86]
MIRSQELYGSYQERQFTTDAAFATPLHVAPKGPRSGIKIYIDEIRPKAEFRSIFFPLQLSNSEPGRRDAFQLYGDLYEWQRGTIDKAITMTLLSFLSQHELCSRFCRHPRPGSMLRLRKLMISQKLTGKETLELGKKERKEWRRTATARSGRAARARTPMRRPALFGETETDRIIRMTPDPDQRRARYHLNRTWKHGHGPPATSTSCDEAERNF